jgi:DNA-binding NarL/FixJ family response regulator
VLVVGAFDTSPETEDHIIKQKPDVILLDFRAHQVFKVAKSLGTILPSAQIVAFGVPDTDADILACVDARIRGYLPLNGTEDNLVTAVDCALRGEVYCTPRAAGVLFRRLESAPQPPFPTRLFQELTSREQQVAELLALGMSNKDISRALQVREATAKNHVHSILKKLRVRRRGEAVARLRDGEQDVLSTGVRQPTRRFPISTPGPSPSPKLP